MIWDYNKLRESLCQSLNDDDDSAEDKAIETFLQVLSVSKECNEIAKKFQKNQKHCVLLKRIMADYQTNIVPQMITATDHSMRYNLCKRLLSKCELLMESPVLCRYTAYQDSFMSYVSRQQDDKPFYEE